MIAVASGYDFIAALRNDGRVVVWGYMGSGVTNVPTEAQSGVAAIAAGAWHMLALKTNGTIVGWGFDCCGQATPPEAAQSGVTSIACGRNSSFAVLGTAFALKTQRSGNNFVISWPTNAIGFTLQSSPGITAPWAWTDAMNSPALQDGRWTITSPTTGTAQYFRLRKP